MRVISVLVIKSILDEVRVEKISLRIHVLKSLSGEVYAYVVGAMCVQGEFAGARRRWSNLKKEKCRPSDDAISF
jgi:pentatricopeptide repeat protein